LIVAKAAFLEDIFRFLAVEDAWGAKFAKSARKNEDEFHKNAEFYADLRTCKKVHAKKVIDRQVKE
jgi:hypothetical protein